MFASLIAFVVAHVGAEVAILTVIFASIANRLPAGRTPTWIQVVIDVLAAVPRPGHVGVLGALNVPGLPSKQPFNGEGIPQGSGSVTTVVLSENTEVKS